MITFVDEDSKSNLKNRRIIKSWIAQVIEQYGFKLGNLCYIFCSDDYILDVNKRYLNHDYYTDIITFDFVESGVVSGDMFISVDTVRSNSAQYSASYTDELHRVIIHGVLHLCGLKDKTPSAEKKMRAAEDKALALLSDLLKK